MPDPQIRIVTTNPAHGSRERLTIFRDADNELNVTFIDENGDAVNISGYSARVSGKQHESESSELFDVSGVILASASGTMRFTVPVSGGAAVFSFPGPLDFRWWTDGNEANPPDGRHRIPFTIEREIGS